MNIYLTTALCVIGLLFLSFCITTYVFHQPYKPIKKKTSLNNQINKTDEVKDCFKFTTEEESIPPEEEKSVGELLKINLKRKDDRNSILRRAYKNGRKINELMEDFNLSRSTVYFILQKQPSVFKNSNHERDLKIVKSYNEGKTIVVISKELNLTYATVVGVIRRRK